jgi:hypothetical protein
MENLEISKQTKDSGLSLKIEDAIQHPLKIVIASDNDISLSLVFAFACVGLPDESIPKGLKKTFLIQFVRDSYKFYSVEEIKTAFLMLVKGELGDKSPKHYNNFSPEYFGSVMACYKSHRENANIHLLTISKDSKPEKIYEPNTIEKTRIQIEFDKTVVSPIFEKYKQFGYLDLGSTPAKLVYNSLVFYYKIIEFTNEEKLKIKTDAIGVLNKKRESLENGHARNYQDHKKKLSILKDLLKAEFVEDEIITECHKICIIKCFQKMEVSNFRF